jgi:hypothetical protein
VASVERRTNPNVVSISARRDADAGRRKGSELSRFRGCQVGLPVRHDDHWRSFRGLNRDGRQETPTVRRCVVPGLGEGRRREGRKLEKRDWRAQFRRAAAEADGDGDNSAVRGSVEDFAPVRRHLASEPPRAETRHLFPLLRFAAAENESAFLAPSAGGDAVIFWNENAGAAATAACLAPLNNPLHESRIYAMMHVAIHDAVNAIDRRSRPYALDVQAAAGASPDAAVAAAARDVLVSLIAQLPLELHRPACITGGVASAEAAYTGALAAIPDGQAKAQGIAVGRAAAVPILQLRADDARVGHF